MNIPELGGVQFFSTEKDVDKIKTTIVLKDKNDNIEDEAIVYFDKKEISGDIDKLNSLFKIDLNRKLNKILTKKIKITHFEFDTGNNISIISFEYKGKVFKNIEIDWQYTEDYLIMKAPYVSGDYFLDTRIFKQTPYEYYIDYLLNSKTEDTSDIIAKTNFLLFFDTMENQRSVHILNLITSFIILLEQYNELFKNNKGVIEKNSIKFTYDINVKTNLETDVLMNISYEDSVYIISDENGINIEALSMFYSKFYKNIKIVKFEPKDTNAKHLENHISIFNGDDILFTTEKNVLKKYLTTGNSYLLDKDNLNIIEVLTPLEIVNIFINNIIKGTLNQN